jgi:hypothetical protein
LKKTRWQTQPSVYIRARQLEGIPNDIHARRIAGDDDLDDIEAKVNIGMVEKAQPGKRGAGEQMLLGGIDGVCGIAEVACAARFDFDKDEIVGRPVAADKVGFPAAFCAEIPMQDFVACPAEVPLGNTFAAPPENVSGVVSRSGTRSGKPG